jgi:hypothetical protein
VKIRAKVHTSFTLNHQIEHLVSGKTSSMAGPRSLGRTNKSPPQLDYLRGQSAISFCEAISLLRTDGSLVVERVRGSPDRPR